MDDFEKRWERATGATIKKLEKMKRDRYHGYVYDCLDRTNPCSPQKARNGVREGVGMVKAYCRVGSTGYKPSKAHDTDAGWDLKCPGNVTIKAHDAAVINLDVCVLIPNGYVGMLKSKSGLNVKHGIRGEGVIDAGYTGSIIAKMYNDSDEDYFVKDGDKIIQLVIMPIAEVELVEGEMPETERGANGFGSSGR